MAPSTKKCVDCVKEEVTTERPAPFPGPRCATHHRRIRKVRAAAAHDRRIVKVYGGERGDYERLYAFQGGLCAGCRRARGTGRRKLAMDHNHTTGERRGLLCAPCNEIVGHFRDDPEAFRRMAEYLENPPARQLFGKSDSDTVETEVQDERVRAASGNDHAAGDGVRSPSGP